MDDLITTLITGAPNLMVALLVIFWQHRQINQLLTEKQQLVERLFEIVEAGAPSKESTAVL